jgi:hypothetical protein
MQLKERAQDLVTNGIYTILNYMVQWMLEIVLHNFGGQKNPNKKWMSFEKKIFLDKIKQKNK